MYRFWDLGGDNHTLLILNLHRGKYFMVRVNRSSYEIVCCMKKKKLCLISHNEFNLSCEYTSSYYATLW